MSALVFLVCLVTMAAAYQHFQDAIPNGASVPNLCDPTRPWQGVGHLLSHGGGRRNKFGVDFQQAGKVWSPRLCEMDSDGDGLTNGQELGDPDCTWTPDSGPPSSKALSHPGICEPVDAPKCQNYNAQFGDMLSCKEKNASCPQIEGDITQKGIKVLDVQLPVTAVPERVTSYHCMLVEFPTNDSYHFVAAKPVIDNKDVVHHMILFGCDDSAEVTVRNSKGQSYECGMVPLRACQSIIAVWGFGLDVDCFDSSSGIRMGNTGFRFAGLQIHYNNPRMLKHQTDQTGLKIYYTDRLRPYDASTFMIGQEFIDIPPFSKSTTVESTCPGKCTKHMFQEPIYITRCIHHMHLLGKSSSVVIHRNGSVLREIATINDYHYDSPTFYNFNPPIMVLPGDDIFVNCTYSSNSNTSVGFGLGTNDEMCYAFLTYYPKQTFLSTSCVQWKSVERCIRRLDHFKNHYGQCHHDAFLDTELPSLARTAFANDSCGHYFHNNECTDLCTEHSRMIYNHTCMQGDLGDYFAMRIGMEPKYANILNICSEAVTSTNDSAFCKMTFEFIIALVLITNLSMYAW